MPPALHVWIEQPRRDEGEMVYRARLEAPGLPLRQLWLRIPEEFAPYVTARADPFAILSVFTAMKTRLPTVIHGEVSPTLLRNLDEFQAAWAAWRPDTYAHVGITADVEREDAEPAPAERTVLAFSGGIDATFSAWRHHRKLCGRRAREISAAVMIHGYDIPVEDRTKFGLAFRHARSMTDSIGVPLMPVRMNLREIEPNWPDLHGACVIGTLALFSNSFGTGMLASSEPYWELALPTGSSPVTDHLLATPSFAVVHDGAEFDRIGKVRVMSQWREAMDHLLVCWEPEADGSNCCRCVKCLRTMLSFRVQGLPCPPAFAHDVRVEDVRAIPLGILGDTSAKEFEDLVRAADAAGLDEPWVPPLRRLVARRRLHRVFGRTKAVSRLRTTLVASPTGRRIWSMLTRRGVPLPA